MYLNSSHPRIRKYLLPITAAILPLAFAQTASAQASCSADDMVEYSPVYFEDFGTGTARTSDPNVLNHTYKDSGNIGDDFYAIGRSQSLRGLWAQTDRTGHADADGNTNGRYLFLNMRGANDGPDGWLGEFYRFDGVSLLPAGDLPAGSSIGGFKFKTSLVGTCFNCNDVPNFTLQLENNADGALLASQTSTSLGLANDEVWKTIELDVIPAPTGITAANLVLQNSQPAGFNGNDVGADNIELIPLVCDNPILDHTKIGVVNTNITGPKDVLDIGDTITYTFTLSNNGTATAYNVGMIETTFSGMGTPPVLTVSSGAADLDGNGDATDVAPGATLIYTATYEISESDLLAGYVDNQALASFEDLLGERFSQPSDGEPSTTENEITQTLLPTIPVVATAETFPEIDGVSGGVTTSIFAGDTQNNNPIDLDDFTVTVGVSDPELTLDPTTGFILVGPNTPAATYSIEYTICQELNPTNCSTVTETVTVFPTADFSITKTNTAGVNGDVDQGADTVTSGATTTYTLTVVNNGPDPVEGAVVTDTIGNGLTCPATNPVTLSGAGVPAGTFTFGDLAGAGITLGLLADTQVAILTYSCTVD